jgi:mannan endo-1,4-beta-mannosidase
MAQKFGGYFHPFPIWAGGSRISRAEKILNRHIDVVMWYQWWDANLLMGGKRARDFQEEWIKRVGERDVFIKWEPWKPGRNLVQPRFALETIISGNHDTYVRAWARAIRKCDRTIYLCPLPEMNGCWNQWSVPIGKHRPEEFVAAWRHLSDIFRDERCSNVLWVWAPNADDTPPEYPMEIFYPGRDYVDVLALSVYNWGTERPWSSWRSFGEIFQPSYDRICTLGDQPVWIAEMGCAPVGGDKGAWIRDALSTMSALPRLEVVNWFNMKKETDWRITGAGVANQF